MTSHLVRARVLAALVAMAVSLLGGAARAQSRPAASEATISVITFGPGDHTFSKFGHDAILLHDPGQPPSRRDLVFNYGTFRFDSPWLIVDFLEGKLSYWLSIGSLSRTVAAYRAHNRTVSVQRLNLPRKTVREIAAFLFDNARPENREYRYDYYRDNCSTRIRDVLDRHLEGRLRAASQAPAPMTYREHTRRLTIESPLLYFALDLAMGSLIDQPLTEWEAMFLPDRVAAKLPELVDESGAPLVVETRVLFEADRPPALDHPPPFQWRFLISGLLVGGLLAGLGWGASRVVRWAQAAALGLVGGIVGVVGILLLVLWFLTDHDVTYWNRNVLLCPAWACSLPVLALGYARARPRSYHLMMRALAICAAGALVAAVLAVFTRQSSGPALSAFLPLWLGALVGVWQRTGRPDLRSALRGRRTESTG